jgi:hypothetical protein
MVTKLSELVGDMKAEALLLIVPSVNVADLVVAAEGGLMITVSRMAVPAVASVTRPAQGSEAASGQLLTMTPQLMGRLS